MSSSIKDYSVERIAHTQQVAYRRGKEVWEVWLDEQILVGRFETEEKAWEAAEDDMIFRQTYKADMAIERMCREL